MSQSHSLEHHFLIAMPGLQPDYFSNALVYLCKHDGEGAMGLVVNRPTELSLGDLLRRLEIEHPLELDAPTLDGGPVETERGFILHSDDQGLESALALGEGLMLSTARQTLQAIGAGEGPRRYLVTLGYTGWGPGQLERELEQGVWLSCPASREVLFEVPFEQRVERAAKLLGIDFHLMTHQAGDA